MKKLFSVFISVLLILSLFCTGTAFAAEPETDLHATLEIQPPSKVFYTVGEAPDYTDGVAVYSAQLEYRYPLSDENCSGLDTSTPGNKTVTVRIDNLTDYFTVVVLHADEPIVKMKDIGKKQWFCEYFGPCMKAGYFEGDDTSKINPENPITRAEMAVVISRIWKSDPRVIGTDSEIASNPFPDVAKGTWYYEAIEACRKAGIVRGTDAGLYEPEAPITREDAVLMLMRIQYTDEELAAIDIENRVAESGVHPTDFHQVSDYARAAMAAALGKIILGDENHAIQPSSSITRAESAAIFFRLFLKDYHWTAPSELPDLPVKELPLIYLSPSNQFANSYAAGNTNEGAQMTKVAEAVQKILSAKGYPVFIAARGTSIKDRPAEAASMNAAVYVPIHSNAGGGVGTYVFYNGSIPGSKELSYEIFNRVAALTGTPYSTRRHKEDFLSLQPNGTPFREIAGPTMPVAFIEVEFHDRVDKANWIINHTDALAKAIADGIMAYCEEYVQ